MAFPAQPNQQPGRAILYLPHRLFDVAQNPFQVPAPQVLHEYPFRMPVDLFFNNPQPLRLNILPKAEETTGQNPTRTAGQVQDLHNSDDVLLDVLICRNFWQNLVNYASNSQPNVARVLHGPGPANNLPMPQSLNSWTMPQNYFLAIATAAEQARGLKTLASWYLHHTNRARNIPSMNCEPSIQSEVYIQMLEPMNAFIKTRYSPIVRVIEGIPSSYPQWGRGCPSLHIHGTANENAGFPDFLLLRSPVHGNHGAVGEVKTWWTYPDTVFTGLFDDTYTIDNGQFFPDSTTLNAKLIKQLWGQLHFFGCRLGFVTNGEKVMAFARVTRNMMVFSEVKLWQDPDVLQGLIGLTYAAVDMQRYPPNVLLNNYLCADREIA